MDLNEAKTLTLDKMDEHGLIPEWQFGWSRSLRLAGQTKWSRYRNGRIVPTNLLLLSQPFTEANDERQVLDTVLHEIAHALVGYNHQHGPVWQAKARELGAVPKATGLATGWVEPPSKYVAHSECGQEFKRNRLPSGKRYCPKCVKAHGYGDLSILIWERRDNGMLALTANISA